MIYVVGPKDKVPEEAVVINTTTSSKTWSRGLSPMILGPVLDYEGKRCWTFENLWQFNKVYDFHIDLKNQINPRWKNWRNKGYASKWSVRYPCGKGAKPLFHWWNSERLGYIEARKHIYIPYYKQLVVQTKAFEELVVLYYQCQENKTDLYLFDYDGYNHKNLDMSLSDVIECTNRLMGHAFILLGILEGTL